MNRAITDAVGSIAFHPLNPLLLSVSGSRHFDEVDSDGEESSDSDSSVLSEVMSRGDARVFIRRHRPQPSFRDNSFRLWRSCSGK
jgi:telomerase Cajal body protein 1